MRKICNHIHGMTVLEQNRKGWLLIMGACHTVLVCFTRLSHVQEISFIIILFFNINLFLEVKFTAHMHALRNVIQVTQHTYGKHAIPFL